jgi:hypothetical protein
LLIAAKKTRIYKFIYSGFQGYRENSCKPLNNMVAHPATPVESGTRCSTAWSKRWLSKAGPKSVAQGRRQPETEQRKSLQPQSDCSP